MSVPPGVRPPPYEQRGNFETIEVYAPVETVQPAQPVQVAEPVEPREERADIAIIGPIAALVLALTISTLVLEHPSAKAVAAALATLGLIVAVVLMMMGRRPRPGRHVARHAIDPNAPDQDGTVRIVPDRAVPDRIAPDRNAVDRSATARIGSGWSTTDPRTTDPRADWRR